MSIFDLLTLLGGLALFLFGMNYMGQALEKVAGSRLKNILAKLTASPLRGLLVGAAVTAIIQSSSATTVMTVGFVNSGVLQLKQAIGLIMGANIGTTITSWILSLTGLDSGLWYIQLQMKTEHIQRLQNGECTIELGFIYSDLLTVLERVSDHCSNIAAYQIGQARQDFDTHAYLNSIKTGNDTDFIRHYQEYQDKYLNKGLAH